MENERWGKTSPYRNQAKYIADPSLEDPKRTKRLWRDVLEVNRKHLQRLVVYLTAQGSSEGNLQRHLYALKLFCSYAQYDLEHATRDQNVETVARIMTTESLAPSSIKAIKVALNVTYRTLWGNEEETHPAVRGLKATMKKQREDHEPAFTLEQIRDIVSAASSLQSQTMFMVAFEGNLRPHEYLEAKVKQIRPHEHGFLLTVITTKTTGVPMRTILLIQSAPYLSRHLQAMHPNPDPEDLLFQTERGKYRGREVSNQAANKELKNVCRRLGIRKSKITLYQFRKAGITHKRLIGIPDAIIEKHAGWTTGTSMLKHYSRVTGEDVTGAILEANGLQASHKKETLEKQICTRCGAENGAADKYCFRCFAPLDDRWVAQQPSTVSEELLKRVIPLLSDEQKQKARDMLKGLLG